MPLQWRPELALGIPELDGQHLQLDAHLRLLHDALCERRVPDVAAVLEGLRGAAERHFFTEERLLGEAGAAGLEAHREAHRTFAAQLERFREACRRDGASVRLATEVAGWLAAWLRDHQAHDVELRRFAPPGLPVGGG
jgi:hemerythrin-like metal-binding protein